MSVNYEDILTKHLASQSPTNKKSTSKSNSKDITMKDKSQSPKTNHNDDLSSKSKRSRKRRHSSISHSHSRSRSRSRSKAKHKKRDKDKDRHSSSHHRHKSRNRDKERRYRERDRERTRTRERERDRDRSSLHNKSKSRHDSSLSTFGDNKNYKKSKNNYRNHSRDRSYKDYRQRDRDRDRNRKVILINGIEEDIDDTEEYEKKVKQELKLKELTIKKEKQLKNQKNIARKARLKKFKKLKLKQKQKQITSSPAVAVAVDEVPSDSTTSTNTVTGAGGSGSGANDKDDNSAINKQQEYDNNNPNMIISNNININPIQTQLDDDNDEEFDIFAQNDQIQSIINNNNKSLINRKSKSNFSENLNLTHNWDDSEGYYIFKLGDIISSSYRVIGSCGRGVYSSVLRVKEINNDNDNKEYVIKVIRNNEHMKKQGLREISFLNCINTLRSNSSSIIQLYNSFWYRNHLCLLFESLQYDLRKLISQIGFTLTGLSIAAIYRYTRQLLSALSLLSQLGIIHADIKPDNILVSSDFLSVKLCDFGSSFKIDEVDITPTIGSRYYRAPEIMIGIKWNNACDMWSLGCTLYEIFSGNFLFNGADNNQMLLKILTLCGQPPNIYKKGLFYANHFDITCTTTNNNQIFLESVYDSVAKFDIQIPHKLNKNKSLNSNNNFNKIILNKLLNNKSSHTIQFTYNEKIKLNEFINLLSKMLVLDPNKRITPKDAKKHAFCINPLIKESNKKNKQKKQKTKIK